jgi:arsenate reductase
MPAFNSTLAAYIAERTAEFDQISPERKAALQKIAQYVDSRAKLGRPAKLTFICTQNSRRSHMAQIWAAAAAAHYSVPGIETFSGGTEATAFNARAVAALQRAGFQITQLDGGANPQYRVEFAVGAMPLVCFSKKYGDQSNPEGDFAAVMTCSAADENCPVINGAMLRVAVAYEDPKLADGAPEETARYDERCRQIAREMLYLFSQVD